MPMQLNLVVIRALLPEVTMSFYESLGLRFTLHRHGKGPLHYAAENDGFTFEIYPLARGQQFPDTTLRLGFEVHNLDELVEKLRKAGTEITQPPRESEWGYRAVVKDPDGKKVELTAYAEA